VAYESEAKQKIGFVKNYKCLMHMRMKNTPTGMHTKVCFKDMFKIVDVGNIFYLILSTWTHIYPHHKLLVHKGS